MPGALPRSARVASMRILLLVLALTLVLVLIGLSHPGVLAAAPSTQESLPTCIPQALVTLPNVRTADPRLNAQAAASFALVRQAVIAQTGQDVLAILADALRAPGFTSDQPGVSYVSWHKAGRAIDLNLGGPFTLHRDGAMFRVFVGAVDLTAIFESHGWSRIPAQGSVAEWWHYEYHPDGIAWESAMAQVWPQSVLAAAFPTIDWATVGCRTGSSRPGDGVPLPAGACAADPPTWEDAPGVSYSRGCGPPVMPPDRARPTGSALRQLVGRVGWIGQTGRLIPAGAAGVHLHLGVDIGQWTNTCRWPLQIAGIPEGQAPPGESWCGTTWVDPLQFLPQANPNTLMLDEGTPVPVVAGPGEASLSDVPVQLPPPGHPAATLLAPADPGRPDGTWWSPGNTDRANRVPGALGGSAMLDWLTQLWCLLFGWLSWSGCGVG